jgi:hypothetical protein
MAALEDGVRQALVKVEIGRSRRRLKRMQIITAGAIRQNRGIEPSCSQ